MACIGVLGIKLMHFRITREQILGRERKKGCGIQLQRKIRLRHRTLSKFEFLERCAGLIGKKA
jgi:hypothetical protein